MAPRRSRPAAEGLLLKLLLVAGLAVLAVFGWLLNWSGAAVARALAASWLGICLAWRFLLRARFEGRDGESDPLARQSGVEETRVPMSVEERGLLLALARVLLAGVAFGVVAWGAWRRWGPHGLGGAWLGFSLLAGLYGALRSADAVNLAVGAFVCFGVGAAVARWYLPRLDRARGATAGEGDLGPVPIGFVAGMGVVVVAPFFLAFCLAMATPG